MDLAKIAPRYSRVKGASWFPLLFERDVMVLGQGGIGSWLTLLLARIGCNLHTFDMDRFEDHNMTGQFISKEYIGINKSEAIANLVSEFTSANIQCNPEAYTEDSFSNNIMICGFDNMKARKIAFENWVKNLDGKSDSNAFFQDGRLLAEQLQIFNIPGDRPDLIDRYQKNYLFSDEEIAEVDCTFKQTSHCAAMIASHMVGFLTNWASNADRISNGKMGGRIIPFSYEYLIPANITI